MILPTELLSTVSIAAAQAGYLLFALDRDRALIWIVEREGTRFAVFLTGEYARRAFAIADNSGGSGAAVGPVQIRVDPTSSSNDGGDWSLRARDGSLSVQFIAEGTGGWTEGSSAPVAPITTQPDTTFYFTRWAIGIEVDEKWCEIVSVADGELKTTA